MKLLIGLLGVAALLFLASLEDEQQPKRCRSCGLDTLVQYYAGHGKPLRYVCTQCGTESTVTM